MKGLIIKDLKVLKNSVKSLIAIVAVFAIIGKFGNNTFLLCFSSVYAAILPMTCMAYDERSHFNRFAKIMPVRTIDIVLSKYITGIIIAAIAAVISLALTFISEGVDIISSVALAVFMPIFYHSIMMPIMFKFGTEKSRLIIMASFAVPGILIVVLAKIGILEKAAALLSDISFGYAFIIVIPLAIYVLSVLLSLAICKNKEWQ